MNHVRLILIGTGGAEFQRAAELARNAGADVVIVEDGVAAAARLRAFGADLVMIDVHEDVRAFISQLRSERMSVPVIACGIDAPAQLAVAAIRAGARDYVPLPPEPEMIEAAITSIALRAPRLPSRDPAMARIEQLALLLAPDVKPILIEGERGSGRETLARAIHDASGRPGRFIVVECAGTAPEVLESALFGHDAGAFPGALARRSGALEQAAEGSVFLRSLDALPETLKSRLVAQASGRVRILAGLSPASASDWAGAARIALPPLRARTADIAPLARHLAAHAAQSEGGAPCSFDASALALLEGQNWSGNVAELEQLVRRLCIANPCAMLRAEDLPLAVAIAPSNIDVGGLVGQTVEDVERELILHTLEHCRGNRTSASNILGISVRTMRNKLRSFIEAGIPVAPAP